MIYSPVYSRSTAYFNFFADSILVLYEEDTCFYISDNGATLL